MIYSASPPQTKRFNMNEMYEGKNKQGEKRKRRIIPLYFKTHV